MRGIRWLGVLYLTMMMGWSPVAPPEHAHEGDDHGDHHVLVHWHAEGHFEGSHATDHPEVGEDEGQSVSLDGAFTLPPELVRSLPVTTTAVLLNEPSISSTPRLLAPDVELLIHGPPRAPAGLRAPPALSRL